MLQIDWCLAGCDGAGSLNWKVWGRFIIRDVKQSKLDVKLSGKQPHPEVGVSKARLVYICLIGRAAQPQIFNRRRRSAKINKNDRDLNTFSSLFSYFPFEELSLRLQKHYHKKILSNHLWTSPRKVWTVSINISRWRSGVRVALKYDSCTRGPGFNPESGQVSLPGFFVKKFSRKSRV